MSRTTEIQSFRGTESEIALAVSGIGLAWETAGLPSASACSKESVSPSDNSCEETKMRGATMPGGAASIVLTELLQTAALDAWATDGGSFR